jgi:hypothetical protein
MRRDRACHAIAQAARRLADAARENRPKRWRDIWSAGHSTSGVTDIPAVENLVARTRDEYRAADPQSAVQR